MRSPWLESILEDAGRGAAQGRRSPLQIAQKRFAGRRDIDDIIFQTVVDQCRAARSVQGVESRRPVTEELQRLIRPARTERLGAIPGTTPLIQITSPHQPPTIDSRPPRPGP